MSVAAPARCATVRVPIAPMLLDPRISSVQISQQLAGHDIELLEERDEWLLARSADGYEGWMHRGYLALDDADRRVVGARERMSLGCVVRTARGDTRALPLRAWLAAEDELLSGEAIDAAGIAARFPRDARAIVDSATRLFVGASYQWGGVTPWGADCSGFAQAIFSLHGVTLPRDAWQQATTGAAGPADILDSRAADLLFFSDRADRRVTHVAIALAGRRIAHCALGRGGFALERLDDRTDEYVAKLRERFVGARAV